MEKALTDLFKSTNVLKTLICNEGIEEIIARRDYGSTRERI